MLKGDAFVLVCAMSLICSAALSPAQSSGVTDIRQSGAKGDGRTDDTGAIGAAIDSVPANGGTVSLAPGVYVISKSIVPARKVRIVCRGTNGPSAGDAGSCRILKSAAFKGTALIFNAPTQGSVVEGISIDGAPGNQGDGIQILANSIALRDVTVVNQGGNGIYIGEDVVRDGTQANSFFLERVRSAKNRGNGYVIRKEDVTGPGWTDANGGTMINCVAQVNGGDGLLIGKANNNTFIGLLLESNSGYGLHLIAGSADQVFVGGDINEGNRLGNVAMEPGNALGSYFIGTDTGKTVTDNGTYKSFILNRSLGMTGGYPMAGVSSNLAVGQSTIISDRGAPAGDCRPGSLYMRADGGPGTTLYVCERGHWAAK